MKKTAVRHLRKYFTVQSRMVAKYFGSPLTLMFAIASVFIWALLGPYYHYSDTWQLIINTGTTIVTFIVAISIQMTQNRDTRAMNKKLNELLNMHEDTKEAIERIEKELDEEDEDGRN